MLIEANVLRDATAADPPLAPPLHVITTIDINVALLQKKQPKSLPCHYSFNRCFLLFFSASTIKPTKYPRLAKGLVT